MVKEKTAAENRRNLVARRVQQPELSREKPVCNHRKVTRITGNNVVLNDMFGDHPAPSLLWCRRCGAIRVTGYYWHVPFGNLGRIKEPYVDGAPTTESWKTIPSLKGDYQASSLGAIRRARAGAHTYPGKIIKPFVSNAGYEMVVLTLNKSHVNRTVHSLVAEAWIGPCPSGKEINHKEGNKLDNRANKLEYLTPKENTIHAQQLILDRHNDRHPSSKLSLKQVKEMMVALSKRRALAESCDSPTETVIALRRAGLTFKDIGRSFKVSWSTVKAMNDGKTWKRFQYLMYQEKGR